MAFYRECNLIFPCCRVVLLIQILDSGRSEAESASDVATELPGQNFRQQTG